MAQQSHWPGVPALPLGVLARLTLLEGLRCTRLKLWDERTREMITFREAGQRLQGRGAGAVGRTDSRFHG